MRRHTLLLLCASGCDFVFLDEPIESTICGPYAAPTPVVFDASIPALTHFSVVGNRALAREKESPHKLRALAFDGTMWKFDSERQANLEMLRTNGKLHYIHLASDTTMFAAVFGARYSISEYTFRTNIWTAEGGVIANDTGADVFPGGALTTGIDDPPNTYRYLVTARVSTEDPKEYSIAVAVKPPMLDMWQAEVSGGVITTAALNERQRVTGGALALGTNNRPTLIYAATPKSVMTGSDLYVSQRISGRFQLGVPLVLGGPNGEELEPSTNEDCTVLYFRRDDQILEARARR